VISIFDVIILFSLAMPLIAILYYLIIKLISNHYFYVSFLIYYLNLKTYYFYVNSMGV